MTQWPHYISALSPTHQRRLSKTITPGLLFIIVMLVSVDKVLCRPEVLGLQGGIIFAAENKRTMCNSG